MKLGIIQKSLSSVIHVLGRLKISDKPKQIIKYAKERLLFQSRMSLLCRIVMLFSVTDNWSPRTNPPFMWTTIIKLFQFFAHFHDCKHNKISAHCPLSFSLLFINMTFVKYIVCYIVEFVGIGKILKSWNVMFVSSWLPTFFLFWFWN